MITRLSELLRSSLLSGKSNFVPLEQEVEQADRVNFERVLFEAFDIFEHYEAIKSSLLHLYRIRFAVKMN